MVEEKILIQEEVANELLLETILIIKKELEEIFK